MTLLHFQQMTYSNQSINKNKKSEKNYDIYSLP